MKAVKPLRWRGAPSADDDALSYAMAMVAVPVAFGALGWWLDSLLSTGPVLMIGLAAFGVVSSFASAFYRYERKIAVHDEGKPWARRAAAPVSMHGESMSGERSLGRGAR